MHSTLFFISQKCDEESIGAVRTVRPSYVPIAQSDKSSNGYNHILRTMASRIALRSGNRLVSRISKYQPHKNHIITRNFTPSSVYLAEPAAATTEEIRPFQWEKADAIFQKVVKLDAVEIKLLVDTVNERLGNIITDEFMERMEQSKGQAASMQEAEDAPQEEAKTDFDVKLTGFEAKAKIKVIKEIRAITSLGLKEAKALVEGAPKVVKASIKMEEAEELKKKLEDVGGTVEII